MIVYPTGGGTGVVGMAKAFDELEALGLVGPDRPRMICVQSGATSPIVRAFDQGDLDITPLPPGKTIATGLNVAQNVGHKNVLRIIRQTRRLRPVCLGRCHQGGDQGRVARTPVRLVARGGRDPGRSARALGSQADPPGGPRRAGQHRGGREVLAYDPGLDGINDRLRAASRVTSRIRNSCDSTGSFTARQAGCRIPCVENPSIMLVACLAELLGRPWR